MSDAPILVPPLWRIVPVSGARGPRAESAGRRDLLLTEGAGWGTGAHETTQLCLQALAHYAPARKGWRLLDFGAGSGLLSIAAAQLGAEVDSIEIDEEGIRHGRQNAATNGFAEQIRYSREIPAEKKYAGVVANILRPILVEYAEALVAGMEPDGWLILSGLVATDVPSVAVRFSSLLSGREPEVFSRGEWRALDWRNR